MSKHIGSILCLGDSYTIGEGLPLHQSFPYQLVQMLRTAGHAFYAPEIVAKTGWTTGELAEHMIHTHFNEHYDFVTLLIGVNNQYRGMTAEDYQDDFDFLLRKAIHYAKGDPQKVMVLSIPDWGATPFAGGKNREKISAAIDAFNEINASHTATQGCHYIEITQAGRAVAGDASMLAADGLHPSEKIYESWAALVKDAIVAALRVG